VTIRFDTIIRDWFWRVKTTWPVTFYVGDVHSDAAAFSGSINHGRRDGPSPYLLIPLMHLDRHSPNLSVSLVHASTARSSRIIYSTSCQIIRYPSILADSQLTGVCLVPFLRSYESYESSRLIHLPHRCSARPGGFPRSLGRFMRGRNNSVPARETYLQNG